MLQVSECEMCAIIPKTEQKGKQLAEDKENGKPDQRQLIPSKVWENALQR